MDDSLVVPRLSLGYALDIGTIREHQEDCIGFADLYGDEVFGAWARARGNLYVLADGAGGHEAGEVASAMAVSHILDSYYREPLVDVETALVSAIRRASHSIGERTLENGTGGRTTVACVAVLGSQLYAANVGDSRVYLVRNGEITQLGEDHSLVAQWVRESKITVEEARTHPYRNIITQALGGIEEVDPSSHWEEIMPGDVIVLCSDGLHGLVDDETIAQVVSLTSDPQSACEELVDRANLAGGLDNIGVIVVNVEGFERRAVNEAETPSNAAESLVFVTRSDGIVHAATAVEIAPGKREGRRFIERLSSLMDRRHAGRDVESAPSS
jgi:protein phosphatase